MWCRLQTNPDSHSTMRVRIRLRHTVYMRHGKYVGTLGGYLVIQGHICEVREVYGNHRGVISVIWSLVSVLLILSSAAFFQLSNKYYMLLCRAISTSFLCTGSKTRGMWLFQLFLFSEVNSLTWGTLYVAVQVFLS